QYYGVTAGGNTTQLGQVPLAPTAADPGIILGRVVGAVTNAGVSNATITVRAGINASSTAALQQLAADSSGYFTITLPAGTYTLTATGRAFATGQRVVVVIGGTTQTGQHIVVNAQPE